jgi:hypothetical protein
MASSRTCPPSSLAPARRYRILETFGRGPASGYVPRGASPQASRASCRTRSAPPFRWPPAVLTGAMIATGAIGLSRALPENERGRRAASRLLAGYGLCLVAAGVFIADPANGFPAGSPAGRPDEFSMHGTLHLVFGSIGSLCLIVVCFVVARIAARHSRSRAARSSVAYRYTRRVDRENRS